MRAIVSLFAAFTVGALAVEALSQRELADLRVKAECAYHDGHADGYVTGWSEADKKFELRARLAKVSR